MLGFLPAALLALNLMIFAGFPTIPYPDNVLILLPLVQFIVMSSTLISQCRSIGP